MKKLPLLLTALLLTTLSCNKIDTSHEVFEILSPVEVSAWDPDYAATVIRKIYVEEFTGHRCTYCPAGAAILKAIMEEDPTIVATAIHCSMLADPTSSPIFKNNYKTPMGDKISADFNIEGLPKAMINRIQTGTNSWGIDRNRWRSTINEVDRTDIKAGIELQCFVNENKKEIETHIAVTIIKEINNPVQLCLILQEDGIISGQTDGNTEIKDYVHNHVLRTSFKGNYGTKLTTNGIVETQLKYSTTFKINYEDGFPYSNLPIEIKNCSVVAYLIDMVTQEIIQVEIWKMG